PSVYRRTSLSACTRRTSVVFSAISSYPAISRASASTSSDQVGSEQTGRLKSCRRAFRAERVRPCAVFGPALACALARLARILRSLVAFKGLSLLWLAARAIYAPARRALARSAAVVRRGRADAD